MTTIDKELLTKESFLNIPVIACNPLRDRICICIGYHKDNDTNSIPNNNDNGTNNDNSNKDNITSTNITTTYNSDDNKVFEISNNNINKENCNNIDNNSNITDENNNNNNNLNSSDPSNKPNNTASSITTKTNSLDFRSFLIGISLFNSIGHREMKMKIAFQLQDFDDDNYLSRDDLKKYLDCVTNNSLPIEDKDVIVQQIFQECTTQEMISFEDFKRVVDLSDFHLKLRLPL